MNGFSAAWLARREPYDVRARNPAVLDALVASLQDLSQIRIVDLACGSGAMLRALAPRLPRRQNWRLVDLDRGLLTQAAARPRPSQIAVEAVQADLSRDLEAALDGPVDAITASALLDLVSESWLDRLINQIASCSLPFHASLNYDGRVEIAPADPFDRAIVAAVNAHQRTNKGFGPALGPAAASFAVARFESLGYSVIRGTSDWALGPADRDIQLDILAGWATAASESGQSAAEIAGWLTRRRQLVLAGQSSIRVGHLDFWACQTGTR